MEGSRKVESFFKLALQGEEEKKITSTPCALFFILTLCSGKNACRFGNMEGHTFFYLPPDDICPLLRNAVSQQGRMLSQE